MQRVAVGLRVDGHAADAELAQRAEDPHRDLAAVRHQDLRERRARRILSLPVRFADQLTVARILAAPLVVAPLRWDFHGHDYWATAVFVAAIVTDWLDGRIARRGGYGTELGSLLDPIADKVLVLSALIVLVGEGVFPRWMVAAIVAREFLVTGLRLAALERGVVIQARDLGKLKTWAPGDGGRARRPGRGRGDRRVDGLVGAARRARPDAGSPAWTTRAWRRECCAAARRKPGRQRLVERRGVLA